MACLFLRNGLSFPGSPHNYLDRSISFSHVDKDSKPMATINPQVLQHSHYLLVILEDSVDLLNHLNRFSSWVCEFLLQHKNMSIISPIIEVSLLIPLPCNTCFQLFTAHFWQQYNYIHVWPYRCTQPQIWVKNLILVDSVISKQEEWFACWFSLFQF